MKNYKTLKIMYNKSLKNRIADYLHRHEKIKVIYRVPVLGNDMAEIGSVCTITGDPKAVWLMGALFRGKTVVQPFALNGEKWFEEA